MGAAGGGLHQGGHWPARRSHRQFPGRARGPDRSCARAIDGVGSCGCSTAGSSLDHADLPPPSSSATPLESLAASQRLQAASPGASASVDHPDSPVEGWPPRGIPPFHQPRSGLAAVDSTPGDPTHRRQSSTGDVCRHGSAATWCNSPSAAPTPKTTHPLGLGTAGPFCSLSTRATGSTNPPCCRSHGYRCCGHCPHDECCESFLELLLPWLDRNLGERRPAGTNQRR